MFRIMLIGFKPEKIGHTMRLLMPMQEDSMILKQLDNVNLMVDGPQLLQVSFSELICIVTQLLFVHLQAAI